MNGVDDVIMTIAFETWTITLYAPSHPVSEGKFHKSVVFICLGSYRCSVNTCEIDICVALYTNDIHMHY